MKTTPRAPVPTQVTTAAKQPNRTKKFLADISAALDVFDDEISSVGDCRATAYETFISSYKTAFAHIWPKIKTADVKIVLQSIKDKELNELRRMSQMMSSDSSKPALIKENRPVPALENILGSMVNRLLDQKLPDKDTCTLISTIFSDLAEAHKHYANAARGIADIANTFHITSAQLHKAMTGIDYQSGPHVYKRKRKATDTPTTGAKIPKTKSALSPAPSTSAPAQEIQKLDEISGESEPDPTDEVLPSADTLPSESSDSLPDVPFK